MGVKQDHAEAVIALLELAPPGGDPMVVLDGYVPPGTQAPYCLVYISTTRPDGTALTGEQDEAVSLITLHCAGGQVLGPGAAAAARAVADRVEAALLGVTPTIAGRSCWPIRSAGDSAPPRADESTGIAIMVQIDTYRLASIPGSIPA